MRARGNFLAARRVYLSPPLVAEGLALFPQPVVSGRACQTAFLHELALASLAGSDVEEALGIVAELSLVPAHRRLAERLRSRSSGQSFAAAARPFFPAWIIATFAAAEPRGDLLGALARIRARLVAERGLLREQAALFSFVACAVLVTYGLSMTFEATTYNLKLGYQADLAFLLIRSVPLLLVLSPLGTLLAVWNQAVHAGRLAVLLGEGADVETATAACSPRTLSRFRPRVLAPSAWSTFAVRAAPEEADPRRRRRIADWSQTRTDAEFYQLFHWYRAIAMPLLSAVMAAFPVLLILGLFLPLGCHHHGW